MTARNDNVRALEEQVRLLPAGLGLDVEDPRSVISPEVLSLAQQGKEVEAVQLLRRLQHVDLVAAKRIVDAARE